jgi:predicted nucleotidyltransferase
LRDNAPELDVEALCAALAKHRIRFVVIGGVAAILHGAPTATFDLDIVPADEPDNLARLSEALVELEAEVRFAGTVRPFADGEWLHGARTWNFRTRLGDFDVLLVPAGTSGFQALADAAGEIDVNGVNTRVASLQDLIAMKEAAGRAKDLMSLPILRWLRDRDGEPPMA